jgi:tRNA A-37 threonylcarbamoyl transferase component Bud32
MLPPSVIVKKKKIGWDEEFENEKRMYGKLEALQGHRIPMFYGEGICDGTRAYILSNIGGKDLIDSAGLNQDYLRTLLKEAFKDMHNLGVTHDDNKLDNYFLVGGKIMFVDLEDCRDLETEEETERADRHSIDHLLRQYRSHQKYLESEA